jgi:protoporphyrinogen oxidase
MSLKQAEIEAPARRPCGEVTMTRTMILGGGMTGLAAGWASGCPVFEAANAPGGICSSYYVRPGDPTRLAEAPADQEAYRFEIGGGHWIFGGDPVVLSLLSRLTPVRRYIRRSSVLLQRQELYVPYPLQDHLRGLPSELVSRALAEMAQPGSSVETMKDWLEASFGPTLCELFFFPFHDLYTAGLYESIAPQDPYKSPVNLKSVIQGAFGQAPAGGYNSTFLYPEAGLDSLARGLGRHCDLRYGKRAMEIDVNARKLRFEDGSCEGYDALISTLPLNHMMSMTGLEVAEQPDPGTSVLVLNIGAKRGPKCPDDHWIYVPESRSGFHRVGCYSNVDASFLPSSSRESGDRVSLYIERATQTPISPEDTRKYQDDVVRELQDWGYIEEAEAVDPTWIEVAYTWSRPGSRWRESAMAKLEDAGIHPVGRYARWVFQGIADSLRDGLYAGAAYRQDRNPKAP